MSIQKGDPIPNAQLFDIDEQGASPGEYGVSSGEAMLQRLGA